MRPQMPPWGGNVGLTLVLTVIFLASAYLASMDQYLAAGNQGTLSSLKQQHLPPLSSSPAVGEEEEEATTANNNYSTNPSYATYIPQDRQRRVGGPVEPGYRESFPAAFTGECAQDSPQWRSSCDAPACTRNHSMPTLLAFKAPNVTRHGQSAADYLQQGVLRRAWGPDPPMIDLYVRAGCGSVHELFHLFSTMQLFFPSFLGDIIIVLDVNDHRAVNLIVPRHVLAAFSVHVVYEHQPCLPGRMFNQYSYLNLYRYSTAEFVVTIDSDCAFHRPVTPDVLFNRKGELILPTSTEFQPSQWHAKQQYFTQVDERAWGHSMVSQPVSFRVETFAEYFAYIARSSRKGQQKTCYERLLVQFLKEYGADHLIFFCWMCQLSTYVKHENRPGYDVHVTDKRWKDPYLRYASHVSYEHAPGGLTYHESVKLSTIQGLCFWLGARVLPECHNNKHLTSGKKKDDYLLKLIFTYNHFDLNSHTPQKRKDAVLREARARLQSVL